MARESKLTPEVQRRIVTSLRAGNYAVVAAKAAGISEPTFYRWMEHGEDKGEENLPEHGTFREFRESVTRAIAEAEEVLVKRWQKHSITDWRAARDLLARRHPEKWKSTERREVTGADGGPINYAWMDDAMEEDENEG